MKGFKLKAARKVRNSQINPLVPGTAILARVKQRKNIEKIGII
jgi:hypothetical protein